MDALSVICWVRSHRTPQGVRGLKYAQHGQNAAADEVAPREGRVD